MYAMVTSRQLQLLGLIEKKVHERTKSEMLTLVTSIVRKI